MQKQAWYIAGVLTLLVGLGFLAVAYSEKGTELDRTRGELSELRAAAETNLAQARILEEKLSGSEARIAQLKEQKEVVTQAQTGLEAEMRAALESKDVTISKLQGKLTVDILDRILFDSGEAQLRPEGEKVLEKVAAVLAAYPQRHVHVIGHTDNVPIRPNARARFASNWELSNLRATAAVRFLSERAGVDPRRLGALGYGEFHPVADNATPEGRAKNRRIAIVVLSEELAGSDVVPTAVLAPAIPAAEPAPDTKPAPAVEPAKAP